MLKCNPDYEDASFAFYRYVPSTAAAVVFVVLFSLITIIHAFQMFKTRTWYLTAFLIGGIFEVIGYVGRILNSREEPGCWTLGPYIIQSIFILVGPACMAASIYMILGRIILLTKAEEHAIIKRRWSTKLFVTGDVFSFFLQGTGGGLMATANETNNMMNIGEYVIIGGLFVQLVVFGFFIVNTGIFHHRLASRPTPASRDPLIRWRWYLMTLYVTSALIWVRSVFRVIEYIQGNDGYLMTTELFIYVFDGTLIFLVMLWMSWFHPSEIKMLLSGETPIRNGLELVTRRKPEKHVSSLHSSSGSAHV